MAISLSAPEPAGAPAPAPVVLTPAEPEVIESEEQAASLVPAVPQGRQLEIGSQAKGFVTDLMKYDVNSPEFRQRVQDVQTLAKKEIEDSSAAPNRLLESRTSSVAGARKTGDSTQQKVAGTLAELRSTVEDLTPNAADLTGVSKILGFIPGGNKLRKYFQKYETAQTQIDKIVKSLLAGRDELAMDNSTLASEESKLWDLMKELNEYAVFAEKLDGEVVAEIEALKTAGNIQGANVLETDVLFAIRQRRQDILTQLAVCVQGYLAMGLTRRNNEELMKGVDRARTTTIQALKTAVIVAQALANQKLVLDQIDAVNKTTNDMIANTSAMLRQNTSRIHEQAVNSGVSVETLTRAFDDIYATMDAIDTFKQQANANMDKTIGSLQVQLERSKKAIDRTQALESSAGRQRELNS